MATGLVLMLVTAFSHGQPATAADSIEQPGWSAQTPLTDLFVETWTTRDGLPHNLVLDVVQSDDGYLWLATWEGLVRFNGLEFVTFDRASVEGLQDNGIRTLHIGPTGVLWIATARGDLLRRDDAASEFRAMQLGLETRPIMDVLETADGTLWILSEDSGVERVDRNGQQRRFSTGDGLGSNVGYAMAQDRMGRILVATGSGLSAIEGDQITTLSVDAGLPDGPALAVEVAGDGTVYVGTERGLYAAGEDLVFRSRHPALESEAVQALLVDPDGTLWMGTIASGLFRLQADRLEQLDVEQGLPNGRVAALFRDDESSVWVSTNSGLVRLSEAPFRSYGTAKGLANDYVRTVLEDDRGTLWVGTSAGLSALSGDRWTTLGQRQGLPGDSILSLGQGSDGALWVGTYYNGLAKLVDGRVQQVIDQSDGLPSNSVRAVLEDRDGTVWVGTSRGLARIRDGELQTFGLEEGLPRELIIALHVDAASTLWIGTTRGVATIRNDVMTAIDLSSYGGVHRVFGFAEEAGGALWMATDRGLLRYHLERFDLLGVEQGLPADSLFSVVDDHVGGLWMSTNRGVLRVAADDANAVADGRAQRISLERFGEGDGMASAQANGGSWPSAIRRGDGSVWVSTAKGVASIAPAERKLAVSEPLRLVIEAVKVDDAQVPPTERLVIEPGARRMEMRFAALTFIQPKRVRYRYQLEGFDPEWVVSGAATYAQFTQLTPGVYRFRVGARREGEPWSNSEASMTVVVAPWFWQRNEFLLFAAFVMVALIGGAYRWRLRHLRADALRLGDLVSVRTQELRRHADRLEAVDEERTQLLGEIKRQSEAFARLAHEDDLTGLANRRAFDEALAREFDAARRDATELSLALIDIDHFKRVNDAYSHAAGDAVLREVAQSMRSLCRSSDVAARWGGEEFAVLLPNTAVSAAIETCERLRLAIAGLDFDHIAPGLQVTVSIGLCGRTGLSHHERMLVRADERLYAAKQGGRNRVMS